MKFDLMDVIQQKLHQQQQHHGIKSDREKQRESERNFINCISCFFTVVVNGMYTNSTHMFSNNNK